MFQHAVGFLVSKCQGQDSVIHGQVLPEGTRVALPSAAASQLPVDSLGIVDFGANHVQSPQIGNALP